jgi:potassium/chloride transporter 9
MEEDPLTVQMHNEAESKKANGDPSAPKPGLGPRPVGGDEKLGLFSGVYVPTCLNVLSILMFLRFGFILGQFWHIYGALSQLANSPQAREEFWVSWAC